LAGTGTAGSAMGPSVMTTVPREEYSPSTNVQNYSPLGRTLSTRVPQGRKRVWPCGDFANASAFATGTLNT